MLKMKVILSHLSYFGTKNKNSSKTLKRKLWELRDKQSSTASPFNVRGCEYFFNETTLNYQNIILN